MKETETVVINFRLKGLKKFKKEIKKVNRLLKKSQVPICVSWADFKTKVTEL